jgi:hypothetical protein
MPKILYGTPTIPSYIPAIMAAVLLAGCASSTEPTTYGDAEYHVDLREEARNLDCAVNETPSCTERIGQPARCFCASRDGLERLLEDPVFKERR